MTIIGQETLRIIGGRIGLILTLRTGGVRAMIDIVLDLSAASSANSTKNPPATTGGF